MSAHGGKVGYAHLGACGRDEPLARQIRRCCPGGQIRAFQIRIGWHAGIFVGRFPVGRGFHLLV